jgi:predicted  nucleic acid-binding Zn-ribbon protein
MGPAELLLHHSRLEERAGALASEIERLEGQLASNPEVERLEERLAKARAAAQEVAIRLRERDREREDHRTKMRARERELMSGRIRNPTELMQISEEVDHMKARLADEEDVEFALMEEAETAEAEVARSAAELEAARSAAEVAAPGLRHRLEQARDQLAAVERERQEAWSQVPAGYQAEYRRLRVRPQVAEVVGGQCAACRVAVTSNQMQQLRRGDAIVHCDNCGRILVVA